MAGIVVSWIQDRMCLGRRGSKLMLGVMARIPLVCLSFGAFAQPSSAQTLPPPIGSPGGTVFGGAGGLPAPAPRSPIMGSQNIDILRHRDSLGRLCLTVYGSPRPHSINKELHEHVISASNSCGQPIKMQVCYYRSHPCILMHIPGWARKEAILGTLSSTWQFQYEFREIF
jgi:hypothetical protein